MTLVREILGYNQNTIISITKEKGMFSFAHCDLQLVAISKNCQFSETWRLLCSFAFTLQPLRNAEKIGTHPWRWLCLHKTHVSEFCEIYIHHSSHPQHQHAHSELIFFFSLTKFDDWYFICFFSCSATQSHNTQQARWKACGHIAWIWNQGHCNLVPWFSMHKG